MASGKPWQILIMLQKTKRDGLLRRQSLLQERLRHAKDLEGRLERYQQEMSLSFRESVRAGPVTPAFLRGSTDFYGKLDEGKAVQQAEISWLEQSVGEVRAAVLACDMEIMKYQKLIQKDVDEKTRREAVAEQKASDNFVNTTVARNLLTTTAWEK